MALPGAPAMPGAQIIRRVGSKHHAIVAGQKHPVTMGKGVHVHIGPGTMFDPNDGSPMVNVHKAFHHSPEKLSPALLTAIRDAVQRAMQLQGMQEQLAPPDADAGAGAPPPQLPGSGMPMAA